MHHIKFSEKEIKLLIETFENSRNAVVNELVSLRERFVVRIAPNVTTY